MKTLNKFGGYAAFYLAAAYITGITIFMVVLDYLNITNIDQKLSLLVEKQAMFYSTNLLMYVFFGIFLVVLTLALHERLSPSAPALTKIATTMGLIWAGSLIASGMISNAGIAPVVSLYGTDPEQAALTLITVETIATNGIGNGNGEILGGVWTLLISLVGLSTNKLPKALNLLGIFIGSVGIVSVFPGLSDLTGVYGITQIVWFMGLGVTLLRTKEAS
ncbi:MAG: DUF4386 family protein [Anaerolineales bacterium]|nr:DUF4386 family protein [Anaerolineales bacterium]